LGPEFRSAVAFYPGCADLAKSDYRPRFPLLIQAGGADDWTPARHCETLAAASKQGARIDIDVYPGAHHAFDGTGKVRARPEVRNPSNPTGWGATVGGNPQARAKSIERTTAWIDAHNRRSPCSTWNGVGSKALFP
jgi:dienelactone hydrolase